MSAASASSGARPSGRPKTAAVAGPRNAARPRSSSTITPSRVHDVAARPAGATRCGCTSRPGHAAAISGRRSAAIQSAGASPDVVARAARPLPASASSHGAQRGSRAASSAVSTPAVTRASCSSSASRGSGQASATTRSMAAASSAPRSPPRAGSVARRVCTACARRSSSGASSRNAYGRAFRSSWQSGDGSGVSRATQLTSPPWMRSRIAVSCGRSIASSRQSRTVCDTSG